MYEFEREKKVKCVNIIEINRKQMIDSFQKKKMILIFENSQKIKNEAYIKN